MTERNVTVALTIDCKVEGEALVQEVGQAVAQQARLGLPRGFVAVPGIIVTPLRVELERAHEKAG